LEIPKRIVLDTTALVNHLRAKGGPSTVTRLEGRVELATTIVNLFELFLGAFKYGEAKTNLTAVKGLSSILRILSFTKEASELAAKILSGLEKAGRGIEIRDLFVGATALQEGYAVATENKEHFQRIPGLTILSEQELLRRL